MKNDRFVLLALVAVLLAAAGLGGYMLGRTGPTPAETTQSTASPQTEEMAAPSSDRQPLYYQAPDGQPFYSSVPKKTADGRDYVPVYEDTGAVAAKQQAYARPDPSSDKGKGKILYYRNPMGLPDTSPVPKKDSMGMDYIPVYESEADSGTVQISPGKLQLLGVRTAPVEIRDALARTVRATGTIELNERTLAVVTMKVGGWVETLHVAATGDPVRKGDPLFDFYSPDLVAAEGEYLVATGIAHNAQPTSEHRGLPNLADVSLDRLRALGIPPDEITRLKRTGKVARTVTVRAPANGIVIEKGAVEGMRVEPDTVLYRTADLSTLWLIASVQEQDLGSVRVWQAARASFVAIPGRSFGGTVDFVYPTLSPETRTARVRIVVPNIDLALRAGMYASAEIDVPATSGKGRVIAVPSSAIIDSGTKQAVLIERGEGRFEPRAVKLGVEGNGYSEILEGVKHGERVVVGANFLIDSESNLRAALQAFSSAAPAEGDSQ